jgi:hypothetical protein
MAGLQSTKSQFLIPNFDAGVLVRARNPRWEPGDGGGPPIPRKSGTGGGDGPPIPGKSGMGMGMGMGKDP